MPRTPRRRIATGVYLDRHSLTGVVKVGDRSREQAFPRDTSTKEIQQWRERERVRLQDEMPADRRGTLAADVALYLARMRKRPASLPAKRSELKAWITALGNKARHHVRPADIDKAIATWLEAEVAPKTVLNRCRTLKHLYTTLGNDKRARTPLDNVDVPRPPERAPLAVHPDTIIAVEKILQAGDPIDRARFMVMAATGVRPSQLMRLETGDVDMARGLVRIPSGKGGRPIVHVLNGDMRAAWQAFVDAEAWGAFDTSALSVVCRRAGWPQGVRVYNAKHSIGIALAEQGAEMSDIQAWFGHTDASTTRIYTGVPQARMAKLSASLDGRLGWALPTPSATPPATPPVDGGPGRNMAVSGGNPQARKKAGLRKTSSKPA